MPRYDTSARKRRINLTLNEDLVARARGLTGNLSGVVEQLLVDYLERSGQDKDERARAVADTVAVWNEHGEKFGSIADDYSPV